MVCVSKEKFGETTDDHDVHIYHLKSNKIEVGIIDYGATIVYLNVPDRNNKKDDIITGFNTLPEYVGTRTFFGATIGRVGNRIAKGKFSIDGKDFQLDINNGPNALHGGINGFDRLMWNGECGTSSVTFRLVSEDGDQRYPGELTVAVTFTLVDNEFVIDYHATTTKSTPINLTNHAFFNLSGHEKWDTDLSNHVIKLPATAYLPADGNCLVTGEISSVEGTLFDLREEKNLSKELLNALPGGGFDHTFCFSEEKKRKLIATLKHPPSGRVMTVESTEPGVQLYTGNFLKGIVGKKDVAYVKHSALCLESQNYPDAINNAGKFPNSVLRPSETYRHTTWLKFGIC